VKPFRNPWRWEGTIHNGMWNYTGPWYPGSQKPAEPKNLEEKADKEEEKKDEAPPKRRNLTSWPPTPE
jgi:hypothetical protein